MILTDGVHLVSDVNNDELHAFARRINLKRAWFQDHRFPHYDLTTPRAAARAIKAGAQQVSTRTIIVALLKREVTP